MRHRFQNSFCFVCVVRCVPDAAPPALRGRVGRVTTRTSCYLPLKPGPASSALSGPPETGHLWVQSKPGANPQPLKMLFRVGLGFLAAAPLVRSAFSRYGSNVVKWEMPGVVLKHELTLSNGEGKVVKLSFSKGLVYKRGPNTFGRHFACWGNSTGIVSNWLR